MGTLGDVLLSNQRFDLVIVEEASQVLESAIWSCLMLADRFVLVGDSKQLPPVVRADDALPGMAVSLFERLLEAHPAACVALTRQYRMCAPILDIASATFYERRLVCGSDAVAAGSWEVSLPEAPAWIRACIEGPPGPVFIDTDGTGHAAVESSPTTNTFEVDCVRALLSSLVPVLGAEQILVIAPYVKQVELLQRVAGAVEVLTIDKSQGRDTRCVIVSLVRCNDNGEIASLLEDARRVNVAITRAKHKLLLIGSGRTAFSHSNPRAEALRSVLRTSSYVSMSQ
jgi:DNA replication ATP-dependent helicase Dna2